jgi:hypothetical protein
MGEDGFFSLGYYKVLKIQKSTQKYVQFEGGK